MIDNFQLIADLIVELNLLKNKEEFLFLQVIQRKKDFEPGKKRLGRNNNSRLIKPYYIYNVEQLLAYKEEIIKLCETFNARAGINLNVRNNKDIAIKCLEILAIAMRKNDEFKGVSKIYSSACGKESSGDRLWIVDLDKEDLKNQAKIEECIDYLQPWEFKNIDTGETYSKIVAKIPSKSGIHLITKRFNRQEFHKSFPEIEIHTNNPTNIFIS